LALLLGANRGIRDWPATDVTDGRVSHNNGNLRLLTRFNQTGRSKGLGAAREGRTLLSSTEEQERSLLLRTKDTIERLPREPIYPDQTRWRQAQTRRETDTTLQVAPTPAAVELTAITTVTRMEVITTPMTMVQRTTTREMEAPPTPLHPAILTRPRRRRERSGKDSSSKLGS
ncbi:hypothetical protein THAOC_27161, partial [Thalassiosira oceanica]